MGNAIRIRLSETDNGEFCFKYEQDNNTRTSHGLTSLIENGIREKSISNGTRIIDSNNTRYVFDYFDTTDLKVAQKPAKIVIKIPNKNFNDIRETVIKLDSLCLTTQYIKSKNMVKILAVSLAGVVLLSIAGAKIADRIKDPKHYDFGRNGEYSSTNDDSNKGKMDQLLQNEKDRIYDEVYNEVHRR